MRNSDAPALGFQTRSFHLCESCWLLAPQGTMGAWRWGLDSPGITPYHRRCWGTCSSRQFPGPQPAPGPRPRLTPLKYPSQGLETTGCVEKVKSGNQAVGRK